MFDANSFNRDTIPYLRAAGISRCVIRGPGHGRVLYRWSTKSTTAYHGADASFTTDESNFANFAILAENLGQAVIVVNYGSRMGDGSGGGEPVEAAAWVAYGDRRSC